MVLLQLLSEDGSSPTKVVLSAVCDPHSSELSRLSASKLLLWSEDRTEVLWQWQNKTSRCCSHIPQGYSSESPFTAGSLSNVLQLMSWQF